LAVGCIAALIHVNGAGPLSHYHALFSRLALLRFRKVIAAAMCPPSHGD